MHRTVIRLVVKQISNFKKKKPPANKSSRLDGFKGEFYQTYGEELLLFSSNYSKKLEKGTLPNSFYEATIILIPKNRQRKTMKKEHYKDNICDKHRCNNR